MAVPPEIVATTAVPNREFPLSRYAITTCVASSVVTEVRNVSAELKTNSDPGIRSVAVAALPNQSSNSTGTTTEDLGDTRTMNPPRTDVAISVP